MRKKRNYKKEYIYHGTPKQKARRAARNRARYKMLKKHGKAKLRGKDVDHKNGNARDNRASNLRVVSKSQNRGFKRSSTGKNLGLRRTR